MAGDPAGGWDLGDTYVISELSLHTCVNWAHLKEADAPSDPDRSYWEQSNRTALHSDETQANVPTVRTVRVYAASGSAEALLYQELRTFIGEFEFESSVGEHHDRSTLKEYYTERRKRWYIIHEDTVVFDPPFRARYVSVEVVDIHDTDEKRLEGWTKEGPLEAVFWKGARWSEVDTVSTQPHPNSGAPPPSAVPPCLR